MFTDACCAVAIARHFSLRKLRRALRRLVRSAPFHEPSLLSFGLLFVRQRVGGGAPVAELAERLGAGVAATREGALAFDELVVRRVFGGRGVEAMAHSMRAEMMRMLQTRPVCAFAPKAASSLRCRVRQAPRAQAAAADSMTWTFLTPTVGTFCYIDPRGVFVLG